MPNMFPRNSKYTCTLYTTCTIMQYNTHVHIHFRTEREKGIVELAKQLKNECQFSKRRARNRKRGNERRKSDTSAQSDVRLGKRQLQQRDMHTSFSVESSKRCQVREAPAPTERHAHFFLSGELKAMSG